MATNQTIPLACTHALVNDLSRDALVEDNLHDRDHGDPGGESAHTSAHFK